MVERVGSEPSDGWALPTVELAEKGQPCRTLTQADGKGRSVFFWLEADTVLQPILKRFRTHLALNVARMHDISASSPDGCCPIEKLLFA